MSVLHHHEQNRVERVCHNRTGPSRELYEERWKQVAKVLFFYVHEVEIEIGHQGRSSVVKSLDMIEELD